jgi:hypothetical protein
MFKNLMRTSGAHRAGQRLLLLADRASGLDHRPQQTRNPALLGANMERGQGAHISHAYPIGYCKHMGDVENLTASVALTYCIGHANTIENSHSRGQSSLLSLSTSPPCQQQLRNVSHGG